MLLEQRVQYMQLRRANELVALRTALHLKWEAERAEFQVRLERKRAIAEEASRKEATRTADIRAKMLASCGNPVLTFDEVLALRPCRRIAAVKRLLGDRWADDQAINAEQAIEVGCTNDDIFWVVSKLKDLR